MIKVFLVEDEIVVREGIKKNIDWPALGYEFCGEASDGELAYPLIQKLQPDIVITDIKMPFMDGLKLSRLIKKEFPSIEIIILSGYQEFGYARQALQIGVAEYLTKPVSGEELLETVRRVAGQIEEKRREQEIKRQYRKEMEEIFQRERRELFQNLVSGKKTVPELLEVASRLHIDISAVWYNLVLITPQSLKHTRDEYSNSLIEIDEKLNTLNNENEVILFDRYLEGKALLFKADSKEELEQLQQKYLEKVVDILNEYNNIRYFGGIGKPVNRLGELPDSYDSAYHAFAYRYINKENRILDSNQLSRRPDNEDEEFNISSVNPKQINRSKIQEFLKFGDKEETGYFVEEFFRDLGTNAIGSLMFRQYITMDIYFCVAEFLEEVELKQDELTSLVATAAIQASEEETMQYVKKIIQTALEIRDRAVTGRYRTVVDEVKQYIEQNSANEELSLNLLARQVNFSPNHLSMLFSQETGSTFIKYLTDFRMNKARQLLRCTAKRSSEISLEVGYKDPHYFSYLFKKTQGITPTQYRGGRSSEDDIN